MGISILSKSEPVVGSLATDAAQLHKKSELGFGLALCTLHFALNGASVSSGSSF